MLERLIADWPLKLVSLVVAFAVWVSITGEDRAVKDLVIPLEVRLLEGHILASAPPTTVTVRLEGPRTVIRKLEPVELAVRLDLRNARPGTRDVQLSDADLAGLPRQVAVGFFEPGRVNLVIDRRMRRELPVVADLVGKPPEGYALYRTHVRPRKLVVEGPETVVSALMHLRTDPLRLDHRTRAFTETVGALPDRKEVRIVDPRPLEVRVIIDSAPIERTFEDVSVAPADAGTEASFFPPNLRVVLSGPPELVSRLKPEQIRVVADVADTRSGSGVPVEADFVGLSDDERWLLTVEALRPHEVTVRHASERSPS